MIERVLIPTDFSPGSDRAVEYAVQHFPNALKKLLHVSEAKDPIPPSDERIQDRLQLRVEREQWARNELVDLAQLFRVQVEQAQGEAAKAIVQHARKWQAQLIVMGSHGINDPQHPEPGQVAQAVMRKSRTPVLIVPNPHAGSEEVKP